MLNWHFIQTKSFFPVPTALNRNVCTV